MSNRGDGVLVQTERVVLSRVPHPFPFGEVAVGDVDGDGDADVMATSSHRLGPGFAHLLVNDGTGGLDLTETWDIGPHAESARLADFDRDGDLDAIIGCNHNFVLPDGAIGNEPLAVLLTNDGTGRFAIDRTWYSEWAFSETLIAAPIDADRAIDIAIMDVAAGVYLALNRGGAPEERLTGYAAYETVWDAAPADFNGDGRMDLALATADQNGRINILFNYGRFPCKPDFNDDGRLNLFDFLAFQSAFGHEHPDADLVEPYGVFNLLDFLEFQTIFGNGC